MTDHGKLSEKAKAIVSEEGDWWGTRLLNQLVQEGCSTINEASREIDHGLGLSCLGIIDFLQSTPQQLSAVQQMISQFQQAIRTVNSDHAGHTKEQIVAEIINSSDAIVECYRNAYIWKRTIEATPVDSRCINAARALARCAEPITEGIDELTYAMYEATEDDDYELRKGHSRKATVDVTAILVARITALDQEIKPIMAILNERDGPPR